MSDEIVLSLHEDAREIVMRALLIGLSSFGEIERLTAEARFLKIAGEIPVSCNSLQPIHPTGADDTVNLFAEALRFVNG